MTRFARAKGSKASNERVCEEATSWHEMKNQLLEKKKEIEDEEKRKEADQMRNSNYQRFLKEKEEQISRNSNWAEFPNLEEKIENDSKKKQKQRKLLLTADEGIESGNDTLNDLSDKINSPKKSKQSSSGETSSESDDEAPEEVSAKIKVDEPKPKKIKQKQQKLKIIVDANLGAQQNKTKGKAAGAEKNGINKTNLTLKQLDLDSLPEDERKKVVKKLERRKRQVEKRKLKKQLKREELISAEGGEQKSVGTNINKSFEKNKAVKAGKFEKKVNSMQENSKVPLKKAKLKQKDGEFKRRKDFQPNKIMINGKEIELVYFEGFPIKKEDGQRLAQLKREMISKGLPRSEIKRSLQLERRRAEKALTREKKKVCFNCRIFGHNLSECPEISNKGNNELIDTSGTGVCFKCGSTEHTSFACRVVQGQNFKFATCFICKEQGHISRQCPDNSRGLYPRGGSCKVCGDVTHLKKDCPQFQVQKERVEEKFKVEAIGGGNPEDLGGGSAIGNVMSSPSVRANKIIKF